MPNVLMVSERETLCSQVREIIERDLEHVTLSVTTEVEQALHCLSLPQPRAWRLAIIDLALSPKRWVPLLQHIQEQASPLPALMIGVQTPDDDVPYAWALGAKGFLLDDFTPEEFIIAFFNLLHGGTYTNARILAALNPQLF